MILDVDGALARVKFVAAKPISEERVQELEERLGISLPQKYRSFLLEWWWSSQRHLVRAGFVPIALGAGSSLYCLRRDGGASNYNADDGVLTDAAVSFTALVEQLVLD